MIKKLVVIIVVLAVSAIGIGVGYHLNAKPNVAQGPFKVVRPNYDYKKPPQKKKSLIPRPEFGGDKKKGPTFHVTELISIKNVPAIYKKK